VIRYRRILFRVLMLGIAVAVTAGLSNLTGSAAAEGESRIRDGRIAFIRCESLCGAPGSRPDIYTMARDGSALRRLTRTRSWERSPDWSPSGRRLVYGCGGTRRDSGNLCRMRADGSHRVPLTEGEFEDSSPDWGQGDRIVFIRTTATGSGPLYMYQLVTIASDGTDERILIEGFGRISDPHWSPDGSAIVYAQSDAAQSDIHVIASDGSDPRNLTGTTQHETDPAWAPDGERIAFSRYVDSRWHIFLTDPSGESESRVTSRKGGLGIEWAPSGRRLLLLRLTNNLHPLFSMHLGNRSTVRLTGGYDTGAPSWKAAL